MTKYTIFCVLGLALVIQGARHWLSPGTNPETTTSNKPVIAANLDANSIKPLTETEHVDSLAVPHLSSKDSPQAEQPARQPSHSFTPGSTFLATAAQETKVPAPENPEAAPPSVLVTTPQPTPLVIKPTFVPKPREADMPALVNQSPTANSVVVGKQETPIDEATDPANERPRLPADFAIKEATTMAENASLIAGTSGNTSSLPDFTTLKPLVDDRVLLVFPTTAQMQIQLDPNPSYGLGGQDPAQPITNAQRFNEARNPAQVKADSLLSHNLLQGAQLAYQQPQFPNTNKLEGKELTIQDLFILTSNRDQRFALLKAYWKIALAMAEYHWAVEEYLTIRTLDGVGVANGRSPSHIYIEAAIFASMARVSETRTQAINAQFELLTLMGGRYRNLPLSVDVPLVGTYNTQFEANYPNPATAPRRLQAINKTIDNRRDTVNSRGIAIDRIFKAWQAAIGLFQQNPNEQNAQVVALAYEQLTRARRGFLASIREYNSDIAEYALTVLDPSFRPDQLARYLTRTPSPRPLWNTSAMNPVETANALPTMADTRTDGQVTPATFAEGAAGDDWSEKTRPMLPSVMKQK